MTTTSATVPATPTAIWPAPTESLSRWHLTPAQIQHYDDHGYVILRNWIPQEVMARVRDAADRWIARGATIDKDDPDARDFHFVDRPTGKVMFRVNYLHNKRERASLELLGCPAVLGAAESMCGPNFVPTYESMVFKQKNDGEEVGWHQDAIHPRAYRIYNCDIYLDESRADGGALRVIPGTHRQKQDICKLYNDHGWNPPGAIAVEMNPGDVLLHDVMIVHGSPRVEGKNLRRTIYYEFRAAEEIVAEGPWDRTWIERRQRIISAALDAHRAAFPSADQHDWRVDDAFRPREAIRDNSELRVAHVVGMPGTYCSAGDAFKIDGDPN